MSTISLKNKRVLITGISGFVGMHLARAVEKKGAKVFGISRSKENLTIFRSNVIDFSKINEIIKKNKIEICFHLAAESLVESGQSDPYQTFKINIIGTLNLLESARINKLEKIIIASTSHVYGNNPVPYKEDYPPKPSRPYETSKTCVDLIAQSYADTFNLPVLIPRFSNTYGPGDTNFNRLIPKTIQSVLHNEAPKMWGGDALRDYIYIDDVVDAYIKLAEIPSATIEKNRIFNFGTGTTISVKDVIAKIIDVANANLKIETNNEVRSLEISEQFVSSEKANRIIKWKPQVTFDAGIVNAIAWYKANS
ncbi:MAG: NAD-dependent epimerase/dehydratase family protein [Candidatus Levyibacteriota bacterium]